MPSREVSTDSGPCDDKARDSAQLGPAREILSDRGPHDPDTRKK
jgi:hypothetical protein